MDYLDHWGLRTRPFENNSGGGLFFPGCEHVEALERLLYLVRDGNMSFGLLTGEIGAGKTIVLHQLCAHLEPHRYHVVHLPNGNFEAFDLLREIVFHLERRRGLRLRRDQVPDGSMYELMGRFFDLLQERVARIGRLMVLVIDEAQELGDKALVELKNLTNLGTRDRNALTVILAGQPELSARVRSLPQIDQRVGLRYHLSFLSHEEVGEYMDFRMSAAGWEGPSAFPAETKREVYALSDGAPREVNRLCKLALDRAYCLGERTVDAEVMHLIGADALQQNAMV